MNERDRRQHRGSSLLFADNAVLIADCEECLQRMVYEMGLMCVRRNLGINVNKSKVMEMTKAGEYRVLNMQLNGDKMEELNCLKYLGADLSSDEGMEAEWKHRVSEGRKVVGNVWKRRKETT